MLEHIINPAVLRFALVSFAGAIILLIICGVSVCRAESAAKKRRERARAARASRAVQRAAQYSKREK